MKFCFVGAGAVGGYYAALLARAGHEVAVLARGAQLDAIRQGGLRVRSTAVGDFTATVAAESDPGRLEPADVAILTVKTYDNDTALPALRQLARPTTVVLTLQNGVDSADEVGRALGEARTLAGATYIATALEAPGIIRQTGSHRRIVFGECFQPVAGPTARVAAIDAAFKEADIQSEGVADVRTALWEKFVYLAPFAAFTGAARLPVGPLWADPDTRAAFLAAIAEVAAVARGSGIALPDDVVSRIQVHGRDSADHPVVPPH